MSKSSQRDDIVITVQLDQTEITAGDVARGRVLLKGPTEVFVDKVPQVTVTISGWELARTQLGKHATLLDKEKLFFRQAILSEAKLVTSYDLSSRYSVSSKRAFSSRNSFQNMFGQSSRAEALPPLCYEFPFQIAIDDQDLPSSMRCGGYFRRGRINGSLYTHPIADTLLAVAGLYYDNIAEAGFRPDVSDLDAGRGCEIQYAAFASYHVYDRNNIVRTDNCKDDFFAGGDLINTLRGEIKSRKAVIQLQARRPPQVPLALSDISHREAVPVATAWFCGQEQESVRVKTSLGQRTYMNCDEIIVRFDSVMSNSSRSIDYFLVELNCRVQWTLRNAEPSFLTPQAKKDKETLPLLREKVTIGDDGMWPPSILKIPKHAFNSYSGQLIECSHSVDVKLQMKGGFCALLVSSTPIIIHRYTTIP